MFLLVYLDSVSLATLFYTRFMVNKSYSKLFINGFS